MTRTNDKFAENPRLQAATGGPHKTSLTITSRFCAVAILTLVIFIPTRTIAQTAPPKTVRITEVTDQAYIGRIITSLQGDLRSVGSKVTITRCTHVIDFVEDMPFGHDSSFGAICLVNDGGTEKQWLMCDDWMVGKFTATDQFTPTTEEIGEFIYNHCPPGG